MTNIKLKDSEKAKEELCVIWALDEDSQLSVKPDWFWDSADDSTESNSILDYVEYHSDRLRAKYLSWLYDLGKTEFAGSSLIQWLAIDSRASFWWMTLLTEKSLWKTPALAKAIRLFAIEEILSEKQPTKVVLYADDLEICQAVDYLCKGLGIPFESRRSAFRKRITLRDLLRRIIPTPIQAFRTLISFLRLNWLLRRVREQNWYDDSGCIFFCSYLYYLIPTSDGDPVRYQSQYWGSLPVLMEEKGLVANWLQIFVPHTEIPNASVALDHIDLFNQKDARNEIHSFVTSFLSVGLLVRVLRRYFSLLLVYYRLALKKRLREYPSLKPWVWSIFEKDWQRSVIGPEAVSSLLWFELFDAALFEIPYQRKGFYICENQVWERAFVSAWNRHGHGELIAVPHATIRYWDLRYFEDPRTFQSKGVFDLPQPHYFALNGPVASQIFIDGKYPTSMLLECEALRYEGIEQSQLKNSELANNSELIRILVFTDFEEAITKRMINMLGSAITDFPIEVSIAVKAHASCPVEKADYPNLDFEVSRKSIKKISEDFDLVFSSSNTSAAVDAFVQGVPVIVFRERSFLNMSPLRGHKDVRFAGTAEELAQMLLDNRNNLKFDEKKNRFFFSDLNLSRWMELVD